MFRSTSATLGFLVAAMMGLAAGQTAPPPQVPGNASPGGAGGGILGRPSPPQPLQKQGVEYFIGSWNFTWTGRESAITPGPRTGIISFTRRGDAPILEFQTTGQADAAGAYKENGTLEWQAAQKRVALREHLPGNITVSSAGDWSSPIAIRFESDPIRVNNQTLKLRRTYGIVSATSFTIAEELSVDGGAFARLGGGVFTKSQK